MNKITFYIARHGKTLMNMLDMVQGWCDSPLTDEGVKVANNLGKGLKEIDFQAAYCSTLRRTLHTAKIVLKAKGQPALPITEVDGFKEAGFGSFEAGPNKLMWNNASLYLQYTSFDAYYKDIENKKITYNEGLDVIKKLDTMGLAEDSSMVRSRTQKALREIAEKELKNGSKNVLVIAHGMCMLSMLGSLGGDQLENTRLDNASVCKVEYQNGEFSVKSMGDMSYVEKGEKL